MRLQFGVHAPIHGIYGYRDFLELAVLADELGFDWLTVGDHFFLPAREYLMIGADPSKPNKLDAWSVLAAVAARTERIKVGTRVSPIPFYLPARLAKIVATVDVISGGRVIFGVGAGRFKGEAVAYGVGWWSHRERIERMLEGLEIILDLWLKDRVTFKGKYYQVLDAPLWPKPIQKPHPPIWFGGSSDAIVEAAVKYGEGIFPVADMPLEKLKELLQRIRRVEKRFSRDKPVALAPAITPYGLGDKSEWIGRIEQHAEAGAKIILLDFTVKRALPPKEAQNLLREFAKEIFPSFR
ncbi:LLM class flavin-dependent oxidoreductase [Candidatus Bathyarchaeota archaeon]|nr:LLM class flavin-dependent oxidoreductase [Candidatus Bathyarchaeota archaeon]